MIYIKTITFPRHGYMVHHRFCERVMAVEANQGDIDEGPSSEGGLTHGKSLKHFSLMIARFMDAVNHETPRNKYRLGYQTGQTISSGQTA